MSITTIQTRPTICIVLQRPIAYLQESAARQVKAYLQQNVDRADEYKRHIKQLEKKISDLEHKYLFQGLAKGTYEKWKMQLETDLRDTREKLFTVLRIADRGWKHYRDSLGKLADLQYFFNAAPTIRPLLTWRSNGISFMKRVFSNFFTAFCVSLKSRVIKGKRAAHS